MTKIAIVVLNYNGEANTVECLKSIEHLSSSNAQLSVILVDNASTEEFQIFPRSGISLRETNFKFQIDLRIMRNKSNLGFSGGNNIGIRYALEHGADYVLILNNDTIVDTNLIAELLKVALLDKTIGIVVPKIYFAKGHEFHKNKYSKDQLGNVIWYAGGIMDWKNVLGGNRGVDEVDKGQYDKSEKTAIATGCCMLVKREIFEKVGILDKRYFLYYEDADLSQRTKKAGFTIYYAPQAFLWHKNASSAGGSGSKLQDYYITRNRLLFGMTYAPLRSKVALIKESIQLLVWGRQWQKKGVMDFYLRNFGKGSFNR